MIWESGPYKEELLQIADTIKFLKLNNNSFDSFELERLVFLASHIIKKLHWSNKLSDDLERLYISVISFDYAYKKINFPEATIKTCLDLSNNHKWFEFYDFSRPVKEKRLLMFICDQLRHSFVFDLLGSEGHDLNLYASGFFFNSDKTKHKKLFFISFDEFVGLIQKVVTDEIVCFEQYRNNEAGILAVKKSSSFKKQ